MVRFLTLSLFSTLVSFSAISYAQEICGDGIDNDANGMTDQNDPACQCQPTITAFPNPVMITDPTVAFSSDTTTGLSYTWIFDDGTTSNANSISHRFAQIEGNHDVLLVAQRGTCQDTSRVTIMVDGGVVFYVPNAFTPNGDEFNNEFKPVFTSGFDPYDFTLTIYNRWGETIFVSHDATVGWDGTYMAVGAQEGSYIWTIEFKDVFLDRRFSHVGDFTMLK